MLERVQPSLHDFTYRSAISYTLFTHLHLNEYGTAFLLLNPYPDLFELSLVDGFQELLFGGKGAAL